MNARSLKTNKIAKRAHASRSKVSTTFERVQAKTRWRMIQARWEMFKVRRLLGSLKLDGARLLKLHPMSALIAAFAAGVAVTKLARHV